MPQLFLLGFRFNTIYGFTTRPRRPATYSHALALNSPLVYPPGRNFLAPLNFRLYSLSAYSPGSQIRSSLISTTSASCLHTYIQLPDSFSLAHINPACLPCLCLCHTYIPVFDSACLISVLLYTGYHVKGPAYRAPEYLSASSPLGFLPCFSFLPPLSARTRVCQKKFTNERMRTGAPL
jgi:hypothetical protein